LQETTFKRTPDLQKYKYKITVNEKTRLCEAWHPSFLPNSYPNDHWKSRLISVFN